MVADDYLALSRDLLQRVLDAKALGTWMTQDDPVAAKKRDKLQAPPEPLAPLSPGIIKRFSFGHTFARDSK